LDQENFSETTRSSTPDYADFSAQDVPDVFSMAERRRSIEEYIQVLKTGNCVKVISFNVTIRSPVQVGLGKSPARKKVNILSGLDFPESQKSSRETFDLTSKSQNLRTIKEKNVGFVEHHSLSEQEVKVFVHVCLYQNIS